MLNLLKVTRKTKHAKRDDALILFMFDTRVRRSEVYALTLGSVDVVNRKAIVLGKGNKTDAMFFSRERAAPSGTISGQGKWTKTARISSVNEGTV